MDLTETTKIIKKILGIFGFSNPKVVKNSRLNSDNNTHTTNNYYGPVIKIENYNRINVPFSKLKTEEDYIQKLNSAYDNNKKENSNKLVISKDKKDFSINQIEVLKQNKSEIEKLKELGLKSEYLELIQNSIFLSKLGRKKIKQEKIKLNSTQKRILNLYTSKWISNFLIKFSGKKSKGIDTNKEFELLVDDSSIIFVNEFTQEKELREQLKSSLHFKGICYLHAIGKRNIEICRVTLDNYYILLDRKEEESEKSNIKFTVKKKLS